MNEIAVQFGVGRRLTGVLTVPDSIRPQSVAVVLMNAGVIHRIGPHRWNVKLARHLAGLGLPVLRVDLSGLGDSAMAGDKPYLEQSVTDLQNAMDYLAGATGAKSFLLAGICSGARNSYNTAQLDARVAGVWMMDEFYFSTPRTALEFWKTKFAREGTVHSTLAIAKRIPKALRSRATALLKRSEASNNVWDNHDIGADDFAQGLQALLARGVRVCLVYSGSRLDLFSYPAQFADRFGHQLPADAIDVHLAPFADHTLTTLRAQTALIDQMSMWCLAIMSPDGKASHAPTKPSAA